MKSMSKTNTDFKLQPITIWVESMFSDCIYPCGDHILLNTTEDKEENES